MAVCPGLRPSVRRTDDTRICDRNNRVISYHGIFDLRASLAGEVLALNSRDRRGIQ